MRKGLLIGIIGAVAGTIIVLLGVYLALDAMANAVARERAGAVIRDLNTGDRRVSVEGVRVRVLSRDLVLSGLQVQAGDGPAVTVGRLIVSNFDWSNPERPRHLTIRAENAALPVPGDDILARTLLTAAGLGSLTVDFSYRYDPGDRTLTLERLRLAPAGAGALAAQATFGDVDGPPLNGPVALQAAMLRATFVQGSLTFSDGGLTARVVEAYAAANGQSAGEARAALAEQIASARADAGEPLLAVMLHAFETFVGQDGATELAIQARPASPVPYAELLALDATSDATRERLGLEITTR